MKYYPIILALSVLSKLSFAQTTHFIHYGIEQGLPQSQVQTIEQDDDGNLWIGTMAGLSKYNGRNFVNYTKKEGLAEDWITASFKDKAGNIWLGHWGGGVTFYNFKERSFKNLDFDIFSNFKTVTAIIEDNSGNIWFGTNGAGIYRYDLQSNSIIAVSSDEELSSDNVTSMCMDKYGNIWIGTDNGIIIYDTRLEISSPEAYRYLNVQSGLNSNKITAISPVTDDEIWIGTEDAGIIVVKSGENGSETVSSNITSKNGLATDNIRTIYKDNENTIWVGTKEKGVIQYSRGMFITFSTKQGLNYHQVNGVLQDREGNYWIGTEVGLNQYRGDRFQIYDESYNLVNNIVWSVLEDSKGNLWFGTNGGVSEFIISKGNNDINVRNYTTKQGPAEDVILSMNEDNEGNIWFGSANGAFRITPGQSGIKAFTTDNGLPNNTIYSIATDDDGNLWFGTREGASEFNVQNSTFTNYTTDNGLGGNHIYRIFKDSKGNLWFGVLGGYLTVYDGKTFRIFDEASGIKHKFILSITEDKTGNIWLGAYGGGLYKYDGAKFINYLSEDGLSSESPSSIIHDNENNIWIGTSKGIDKYDQRTNTFTHYGKNEGFLGIETNANAVCKDREGSLWFGTIMGAVKFDPDKDKPNTAEPLTYIDKLRINLKDARFPDNNSFSYNQNHLTFFFTGISLTDPKKVTYQFQLEGLDNNWSPPAKENYVMYSNLSYGEYKFLVKANNGSGVWNEQPATYTFTITPPFWRTYWFYALCVLIVLGVVYLFDKIRTANLKRTQRELEEKVRQRTVELAEKNKELAAKNNDITASIRYAQRIQAAIMPPETILKKHYPNSFVLFKPKAIVSGDFYWIEEKDGALLLSAVDCTGHGVPGAFMSIVGYNILNQTINEQGIIIPGKILDNLNAGISETLRQTVKEHTVKDGMDLAFCSIDIKTNALQYAGAYNPLYLLRKTASGSSNGKYELIETRANKFSIGTYLGEEARPFTNHKIQLQKGDTIYIFSDGFVDQFGGPKGKKFMAKQLKDLFLSIQEMGMEEQKEHIDKTMEQWKGDEEQVDDILVMGVRV